MIHGNNIGVDVADVTVSGLNAGKDEAVDQDGETLAARDRANNLGRFSGLGEKLSFIGMIGTIHEADIVSPRG